MSSPLELFKENFIQNDFYFRELTNIRERIGNLLENKVFRHFTDHSTNHSDRMVEIFHIIIKPHLAMSTEEVKLNEALIAFAHKENIDTVFGSNNKVKISVSERISFPSKSDKKRDDLNNILKDAGKWDEVSDLDVYTLIRKMKDKDLPQGLIEQIQTFQNVERSERIYLSKIKNRDE